MVSAYALNNGADRPRRFEVSYRDGRYHRLGRGFLGFGERLVTDLDTGAATLDVYDHVTFDDELRGCRASQGRSRSSSRSFQRTTARHISHCRPSAG
ncbi:hypothetical protein BE20_23450 [Sorangium cellulosum]|nr:hypothetical protein BE20_23450 [Sorangium cellulosum]